jgi:2,5-furandicarboxylate decarboxylase 1
MPKDLRTFIEQVRERYPDDFLRVTREVDPNFELTGVLRKLQDESRYPMVMFENVKDVDVPVLGNALGSRDRLALLFDVERDHLIDAYAERQGTFLEPERVETGPVKEVVETGEAVDATRLARIVHSEGDAGPYISSGVVIARDSETGVYNAGIYRTQVVGPRKFRMYPGAYSHLWHLHRAAEERGEPLEVAVVIGHYPTLHMASQYRGPLEVDEIEVAGGLTGAPLRMVPAETLDIDVPADAEIVIEGRLLPEVREEEGPFAEFSWTLGPSAMTPVMEVSAITRRADAIYQDVFNAHPEHNLIGMVGREANMLAKVRATIPSVRGVCLPFSACCRFAAYVSIDKKYNGQARNAALTALGADPFVKLVIVVDDDVNPYNEAEVMWAVATRVQADRDVIVIPEAYVVELDPSAYALGDREKDGYLNAKWMIDATKPVGVPYQERSSVPREVWKDMRLEDYLEPGAKAAPRS